jgi:hypothetical protein
MAVAIIVIVVMRYILLPVWKGLELSEKGVAV